MVSAAYISWAGSLTGGEDEAVGNPCSPKGPGTCLPLKRQQTYELEGASWCCALTPKDRVEFRQEGFPLEAVQMLNFLKVRQYFEPF